ncbi:hypothetical protein GQ457_01G015680 [Hibiscus cannabinus]
MSGYQLSFQQILKRLNQTSITQDILVGLGILQGLHKEKTSFIEGVEDNHNVINHHHATSKNHPSHPPPFKSRVFGDLKLHIFFLIGTQFNWMFRRDKPCDTSGSNYRNKPSLPDIPPFRGISDPDAYCDWENKIDDMFDKHSHTEKCLLDISGFINHAASWWNRLVKDRQFYYKR